MKHTLTKVLPLVALGIAINAPTHAAFWQKKPTDDNAVSSQTTDRQNARQGQNTQRPERSQSVNAEQNGNQPKFDQNRQHQNDQPDNHRADQSRQNSQNGQEIRHQNNQQWQQDRQQPAGRGDPQNQRGEPINNHQSRQAPQGQFRPGKEYQVIGHMDKGAYNQARILNRYDNGSVRVRTKEGKVLLVLANTLEIISILTN